MNRKTFSPSAFLSHRNATEDSFTRLEHIAARGVLAFHGWELLGGTVLAAVKNNL